MPLTLSLRDLAATHPGLTDPVASAYAEAAAVCLDRHHEPPTEFVATGEARHDDVLLSWDRTTTRQRLAWSNQTDVIEAGAIAVALAYVSTAHNLIAFSRARRGSGADYILTSIRAGVPDLEQRLRLEVSGSDRGREPDIERRLVQKLQQLRRGDPYTGGMAIVVGFRARTIRFARLDVG